MSETTYLATGLIEGRISAFEITNNLERTIVYDNHTAYVQQRSQRVDGVIELPTGKNYSGKVVQVKREGRKVQMNRGRMNKGIYDGKDVPVQEDSIVL